MFRVELETKGLHGSATILFAHKSVSDFGFCCGCSAAAVFFCFSQPDTKCPEKSCFGF